ncbi:MULTISPECIES: hypothetical protein [unclassified Empedobacter]|uniref:hypothetical protein n=1 Tax=unclassified Empedobacter TaxID=2643773 RepID=UPI0025B899D2|nr:MULTISPECIES: hypothetical protein [unclassified Empedobacter]
MGTNLEQISIPKFIHCENEPKTGDFLHDNRQFIYCPEYLSLIEIIPLDDIQIAYPMEQFQKSFLYFSDHFKSEEEYLLVFVQNNVKLIESNNEIVHLQNGTEPMTEEKLIDEAWDYYKTYLIMEDKKN